MSAKVVIPRKTSKKIFPLSTAVFLTLWIGAGKVTATTAPALNVNVGSPVALNATTTLLGAMTNLSSGTLTLAVDWGDGTAVQLLSTDSSGTNFSLSHPYTTLPPGQTENVFNISLTLTAGDGINNTGFLNASFQDLLRRPIDPSSQTFYLQYLSLGNTREQTANSIMASVEYRTVLVAQFYQKFLHRSPASAETSNGASLLGSGTTDEQFAATLLSSAEYFANRSGSSDSGFLDALYYDLLNRAVDPTSRSTFLSALNGGTLSRSQVATAILSSPEYRTDLIQALYQHLLHRSASNGEVQTFVSLLNGGSTDEQVAATLAGSPEYYNNRSGGTAAMTTAVMVVKPPRISSFSISNGIPHLIGTGGASTVYTIQYSINLRDWNTAGTAASDTGGAFTFDDFAADLSSNRFYRVLAP